MKLSLSPRHSLVPLSLLSTLLAFAVACNSDEPAEETDSGSGGSSSGDGDGDTSTGGTETGAGGSDPGSGGSEASGGMGGAPPMSIPRPQLTESEAENFTVLEWLAEKGPVNGPTTDPWDPTAGLGDIAGFTPTYTVSETGGTHDTVQGAIDAAVAAGGTDRVFIAVEPGEYRELICLSSAQPPITLYGTGSLPEDVVIAYDNYAGKTKTMEEVGNPCAASTGSTTYGTSGSATAVVVAAGFHAKNLTFENDTDETGLSGSLQAVALTAQGDKTILENVRLVGNQDTFYAKGANPLIITRIFVKDSYIEGDTDFIFGHARLVITGSTLHASGSRKPNSVIVAPSTHALNEFGYLVHASTVTADDNVTQVQLGRAWDEGQGTLDAYKQNVTTGDYPNGMAVFRETELNVPIPSAPWAPAGTTGRPFSSVEADGAPANRLYEFENTGSGALP